MSSSNSPCTACKLLRRKCTQGCVFAPYFPPDNPAKFASVHRIFGASNVSKLLNDLPAAQREDAVNSLAYEADARIRDPVYGCVSYISILQAQDQAGARRARRRAQGPGRLHWARGLHAFRRHAAAVPPPVCRRRRASRDGHGSRRRCRAAAARSPAPAADHDAGPAPPPPAPADGCCCAEAQQQQQLAVEVAREQDVMMRQAVVYAHAVPGTGATVAVGPPDAVPYEGGFLFQQHQQPPSQAQTTVALTYQMEQSPPPSSPGQSHSHPEVSQQQNTDGSDEGSGGGGVAPPA